MTTYEYSPDAFGTPERKHPVVQPADTGPTCGPGEGDAVSETATDKAVPGHETILQRENVLEEDDYVASDEDTDEDFDEDADDGDAANGDPDDEEGGEPEKPMDVKRAVDTRVDAVPRTVTLTSQISFWDVAYKHTGDVICGISICACVWMLTNTFIAMIALNCGYEQRQITVDRETGWVRQGMYSPPPPPRPMSDLERRQQPH